MDLPNSTALFTDPDHEAPTTLTKQHLRSEIYEAYQATQDQLNQDKTELEQGVADLESTIDQLKADINTFRSLAGQKMVA